MVFFQPPESLKLNFVRVIVMRTHFDEKPEPLFHSRFSTQKRAKWNWKLSGHFYKLRRDNGLLYVEVEVRTRTPHFFILTSEFQPRSNIFFTTFGSLINVVTTLFFWQNVVTTLNSICFQSFIFFFYLYFSNPYLLILLGLQQLNLIISL